MHARGLAAVRPDVVTARYNLLSPLYGDGETDIFAFAARHGIGVIVKQVLGQGLLLKPDMARVALGYALQMVPGAPALVGFRNADQIHALIASLGDPLTAAELAEIRAALNPKPEERNPFREIH